MNREIKFRGKAINGDKQWVYGGILPDYRGAVHIIPTFGSFVAVDPATVGQFTGLYDADGWDVYEGDVLTPGYIPEDWNVLYIVQFCNGAFVDDGGGYLISGLISDEFCRVVGTIHDPKPDTR